MNIRYKKVAVGPRFGPHNQLGFFNGYSPPRKDIALSVTSSAAASAFRFKNV